jgi:sugar lactone lactonase YvrE
VTGSGSGSAADPNSKIVTGFSTPESALYDAGADVIYVSNINGTPSEVDDNGFISAVLPDGSVKELKWIDGAKDDIELDAPKGMALSGGTLWVADITVVRKFDAVTGKPTGEVKVDGASFLNDVVADGEGGVFVTDSGLDAKFEATGSDAVLHVHKDGKVTPVIKNKDLGHPNGVWLTADGNLWVVTFGSGELYSVPAKGGAASRPEKLAKGQLDGILQIDGGDLMVSSWEGSAVFRGKPGGPWTEVASGLEAPADIGWDSKRKALLVPQFQNNQLVIKTLP